MIGKTFFVGFIHPQIRPFIFYDICIMTKVRIAILDDYQQVAFEYADWTPIKERADVVVLNDHLALEDQVIERLKGFAIICVMRERTPLTRYILSQLKLSGLQLVISTGTRNASIDSQAADELGLVIKHTGYLQTGAPELTWALLMNLARKVYIEQDNFRNGGWQTTVGTDLSGKTLGIVGLGKIGSRIAAFANVFDMNVIAWSPNLTSEKAIGAGAKLVSKGELFRQADFVTVHLVLSERSKNIIGAPEFALMKPSAYLINTSRGPLVDEGALLDALTNNQIAGAALDVFAVEPLPADHPFRRLPNLLATTHIGYVTEDTYRIFYGDTVQIISDWLNLN